jgi:hypothetical protein
MSDSAEAPVGNPLIRQRSLTPAAEGDLDSAPPAKKIRTDSNENADSVEPSAKLADHVVDEEEAMAAEAPSVTQLVPNTAESAVAASAGLLPGAKLPPSSIIFANPDGQLGRIAGDDGLYHIRESDAGIIEYLSDKNKKMEGVIKQRLVESVSRPSIATRQRSCRIMRMLMTCTSRDITVHQIYRLYGL